MVLVGLGRDLVLVVVYAVCFVRSTPDYRTALYVPGWHSHWVHQSADDRPGLDLGRTAKAGRRLTARNGTACFPAVWSSWIAA